MGVRRRNLGLVAVTMAVGAVVIFSGCSALDPTTAQLKSGLATMVDGAQDSVWFDRDAFLADPEAAIAADGVYADLRPNFADATLSLPDGSWKVIDVAADSDALTLTLTVTGRSETGGGLFYEQHSARTCFRLVLPRDRAEIRTESAECANNEGRPTSDLGLRQDRMYDLSELDVDMLVDASDHEPLPCQCHSGGDCDCPGG